MDDRSSSTRSVCVSQTFPRTREREEERRGVWGYPNMLGIMGFKASYLALLTPPPDALVLISSLILTLVRWALGFTNHSKTTR